MQLPRETSSGTATTRIAQSERAYPLHIAPTKEPAALPGRHPPARVRSLRLPVHFIPFYSNFSVFARVPFGDRLKLMPAAPELLGAPPAARARNTCAFGGATAGRGTPKDAAALLPAARGRPMTKQKQPKPAVCFKSTVFNSRKSKMGNCRCWGFVDALTSNPSIYRTSIWYRSNRRSLALSARIRLAGLQSTCDDRLPLFLRRNRPFFDFFRHFSVLGNLLQIMCEIGLDQDRRVNETSCPENALKVGRHAHALGRPRWRRRREVHNHVAR